MDLCPLFPWICAEDSYQVTEWAMCSFAETVLMLPSMAVPKSIPHCTAPVVQSLHILQEPFIDETQRAGTCRNWDLAVPVVPQPPPRPTPQAEFFLPDIISCPLVISISS